MTSCSCFLCSSPVHYDTNEDIREKYKDIVGINLCIKSHLCHICSHVLYKLWHFHSLCVRRSMEYPILFSEKMIVNLQRNGLQIHSICSEVNCVDVQTNTHVFVNYDSFDKNYSEFNDTDKEIIDERIVKPDKSLENMSDMSFSNSVNNESYTDSNFKSDQSENSDLDSYQSIENNNDFHQNTISGDIKYDHKLVHEGNEIDKESANKTQRDRKKKNKKKEGFIKTVLSVEMQKAELDAKRKEKKYIDSEFKCYNCAMGFLFKDTYQTHMMRHEESNGEYLCDICSLRFASSSVLRAHIAVHRDRYTCTVCQQAVRGKSRKYHADSCHLGVTASASCHLCGRVYKDSNRLQQHLKRFHQWKSSSKTYRCNVCGEQCTNQAAVRAHMIKHVNKWFSCNECARAFSSPYTLSRHTLTHTNKNNCNNMYYCELCRVSFSTKKSLLAHNRNALKHQQSCYWCPTCSRSFGTRLSLKRHTDSVHMLRAKTSKSNPPPTVICHLCAGSFKGVSKLNRHLKEVCEKAKLEEQLSCYYEQTGG